MVLSMLVAIIAAPGLLGSQEAIRQSQSKEKREEHRARRCNLIATSIKSSRRSREIDGRPIVLRYGRLWIDTGTEDGAPLGHMYAGYYLPYPDEKYEGLVTTITDEAPIMNWVYIDRETHEVKYGVRLDAQPNFTGPFDCTRQDRRLTFDGWEGFCAVEQALGLWGLYFDVDDNGLRGKVALGTRVLEVELARKEKRFQKDTGARQQDQTTKKKIDPREEAPVDEALGPDALVERPGVVGDTVESNEESQMPEVRMEEAMPKPFKLLKSIFENRRPLLEGSMFERSNTPPPAYERTNTSSMVMGSASTATTATENLPQSSSQGGQNGLIPPKEVREDVARLDIKSSPASEQSRDRSTSPAALQPASSNEKNTTPRLNRVSGTKALAQAQMFEALAAAQKPKSNIRQSSTNRGSRASSASQYSRDSQDLGKDINSDKARAILPTPAPLVLAPSKKEVQTPELLVKRPKTPPRQQALTDPSDPAVFGAKARSVVGSREPIRRPSQSATKPSVSRSTSQVSTQTPLQRRGTVPVRPPATRSPRDPPQTNKMGALSSLSSTMTSGRGNRGMATRLGGPKERGQPARSTTLQATSRIVTGRKTTSALFREIDDLVSQDVSGNNSKV